MSGAKREYEKYCEFLIYNSKDSIKEEMDTRYDQDLMCNMYIEDYEEHPDEGENHE